MHLYLLIGFFLITAIPFGAAAAVTAAQDGSGDQEEQPHQRSHFHNWDYKDLSSTAFEDLPPSTDEPKPLEFDQSEHCPDGWIRYSDSCYFLENELLGFATADRKCSDKHATLFVANSQEEWDVIRNHTKDAYFSWIGLVRFSRYEKFEQLPRWQTTGSINPNQLNWLVKPYNPLTNGYSSISNCVAHFKSPIDKMSYTFFNPCVSMFYSICERNATIFKL